MSGRGRRILIQRRAWWDWESLDIGPCTLTEAIEALERLPEEDLVVRRVIKPPAVLQAVRGVVFGRGIEITGIRSPQGRWIEVWRVNSWEG